MLVILNMSFCFYPAYLLDSIGCVCWRRGDVQYRMVPSNQLATAIDTAKNIDLHLLLKGQVVIPLRFRGFLSAHGRFFEY